MSKVEEKFSGGPFYYFLLVYQLIEPLSVLFQLHCIRAVHTLLATW